MAAPLAMRTFAAVEMDASATAHFLITEPAGD